MKIVILTDEQYKELMYVLPNTTQIYDHVVENTLTDNEVEALEYAIDNVAEVYAGLGEDDCDPDDPEDYERVVGYGNTLVKFYNRTFSKEDMKL
jgi:hypothetical protein